MLNYFDHIAIKGMRREIPYQKIYTFFTGEENNILKKIVTEILIELRTKSLTINFCSYLLLNLCLISQVMILVLSYVSVFICSTFSL